MSPLTPTLNSTHALNCKGKNRTCFGVDIDAEDKSIPDVRGPSDDMSNSTLRELRLERDWLNACRFHFFKYAVAGQYLAFFDRTMPRLVA